MERDPIFRGCAMMTRRDSAADTMQFARRFIPLLCAACIVPVSGYSQSAAQSASSTQNAGSAAIPIEWTGPLRQLAAEIADAVKPAKAVALATENKFSLDQSWIAAIRDALASQLAQSGFQVRAGQATDGAAPGSADSVNVKLVMSQATDGYVWIAEIEHPDSQQIVIVGAPTPTASASAPPSVPVLQRRIWLQQREPVLDFVARPFGPMTSWHVLEPGGYAVSTDLSRSIPDQPRPLGNAPQSRDLRGRLTLDANGSPTILVGAATCAEDSGEPSLFCGSHPAAQWPVGGDWHATYDGDHNYFQAESLSSDGESWKLPAFFSAAAYVSGYDGPTEVILAELDGKARLYSSGATSPQAVFSGWGDEIATLPVSCDPNWHVLVTGPGDWTQPDYVQMYRIDGDQATAEGERLDIAGPIVSMWTPPNEKSVRVVSRNLQTGMYEASLVSASCGN